MDWGALCHRLSRDYGWSPTVIFGFTASDALLYLEARRNRPTSVFVSPRMAAEIAAAARARRVARVDEVLKFGLREIKGHETPGVWERLIAATLCEDADSTNEAGEEERGARDRARAADTMASNDRRWLQKILEELRALRQSLGGSGSRALWGE